MAWYNFLKNKKERQRKLKKEILAIESRAKSFAQDENSKNYSATAELNIKCGHCRSSNVNDRIRRTQGNTDGFTGGNFLNIYGSIHGSIDTHAVNKCNDCGHEWVKLKTPWRSPRDIIESQLTHIRWYLQNFYDADHCSFDSDNDDDVKYTSIEEKRKALYARARSYYVIKELKEFWQDTSITALKAIAKKYSSTYSYSSFKDYFNVEYLLEIGFRK